MDYYKKLEGKKARRITFCIREGEDKYYLLMSIIEVLEPDMQDYEDFPVGSPPIEKNGHYYKTKSYNVCMKMDWIELNEKFLMAPNMYYTIGDSPIECYNNKFENRPMQNEPPYILQDTHNESLNEIQQILPFRQCSKFLYAFIDKTKYIVKIIANNEYLQTQLSELSIKHYGVDLSRFPDCFGDTYVVQYNPYFRQVHISKSDIPKGLYINFDFRPNVEGDLCVRISNKNRAGFYSFEKDFKISTSKSVYFIALPSIPDIVSVKVFDSEKNLIYFYDNMSFIRSIDIDMKLKDKEVKVEHNTKNGLQEKPVEKYISESFSIGKPFDGDVIMGEKMSVNAYKFLERRLEFLFFDGEKQNKSNNIRKAKVAIKEILSKAKRRCIICDPYFNLKDLMEYVFTMQSMDVVVKILGSREYIAKKAETKKKVARKIDESIKKYISKVGGEIQFRLLTGKSPLHDRFIVVDDAVWLLGSSFNEIGSRATTIVKVPQEACKHICNTAEMWWSDNNYSEPLEKEYA